MTCAATLEPKLGLLSINFKTSSVIKQQNFPENAKLGGKNLTILSSTLQSHELRSERIGSIFLWKSSQYLIKTIAKSKN